MGESEYDNGGRAFVSELIVHNFYNLSALLLLVDAERKLSSGVKHLIFLPRGMFFSSSFAILYAAQW
ncbi:hypothetical protein CQW29_09170 [Pantoea coffeiphila]|uniref:Uncharacterized protein n=1 Tax=Pantoea coffeiphila TaxID=1465635 RepID=A0A2S9ID53_9GAMM|nr:hypothetical protein CQW29_09170 [Pantoea coffeiphila]